jgi:hypothetical protein
MGQERGTCLRLKITLGCGESKPLGLLCEQEWRDGGAVAGLCGETHPSNRLARSPGGVSPVVALPHTGYFLSLVSGY